jgi:hypothetical protein
MALSAMAVASPGRGSSVLKCQCEGGDRLFSLVRQRLGQPPWWPSQNVSINRRICWLPTARRLTTKVKAEELTAATGRSAEEARLSLVRHWTAGWSRPNVASPS